MCVGLQNVRGWFGFQGFPGSRSVLFGAGGGGRGRTHHVETLETPLMDTAQYCPYYPQYPGIVHQPWG